MTETKFTPGPWHFLEADSHAEDYNADKPLTICGPNKDDLASIYSADDATVSISRDEAVANAHLIEAAPDLHEATYLLAGALEVLVAEGGFEDRRVCVEGRNWMTFSQILDIADAALGKAKGP